MGIEQSQEVKAIKAVELDDMVQVYFSSRGELPNEDKTYSFEECEGLTLPDSIAELRKFSKETDGLVFLSLAVGMITTWSTIRHHDFLVAKPQLYEWLDQRGLQVEPYTPTEVGVHSSF